MGRPGSDVTRMKSESPPITKSDGGLVPRSEESTVERMKPVHTDLIWFKADQTGLVWVSQYFVKQFKVDYCW